MPKIIRVSNISRGKKLVVIQDNDLLQFIESVHKKFSLDENTQLNFQDDQGAEVDDEVFPILLDQVAVPNIVFTVLGEEQQHLELNVNLGGGNFGQQIIYVQPNSAEFTTPKVFRTDETEITSFQHVLKGLIEGDEQLSRLVSAANEKGSVDDTTGSFLIKEFVAKLVELKGNSPSTKEQKLFAKAIVLVVPAWKFPETQDGIDILYDELNRAGKIQVRLRAIHKSLHKSSGQVTIKRKQLFQGGPKSKTVASEVSPVPDDIEEKVNLLNSTTSKDITKIQELMRQTLNHRNSLRKTGSESVLKLYRKFTESPILVNLEFSLLFEEASSRFLELWPQASQKILEFAKTVTGPPALKKFLGEELESWDPFIGSLFILLHLIPPAAQGKGKGSRIKVSDAKERLISYYKTGTPHQSILDTWSSQKSQPNLVCIGTTRAQLQSFFIVCDRLIVPIECTSSHEAIDVLFKSHYAFGTDYDPNLVGFWKFMQVYIYKIDVEETNLPHTAKKVFSQLHECFT